MFPYRAEKAAARMDKCYSAAWESCCLTDEAVTMLWLNPPYDDDRHSNEKRLELTYRLPEGDQPDAGLYQSQDLARLGVGTLGDQDRFVQMSLTGVDFTTRSRPVFTRYSRSVFTRHDRPVFTTHRRPVFTTVAESLPRPQWERNNEHGADPHEHLHRNHLSIASE